MSLPKRFRESSAQAIITAAFVDDILALMAYGVLMDIGTKDPDEGMSAMTILKPCFGVTEDRASEELPKAF